MKVVLDTNVLVSGLLTPTGTCGQIVDLFIAGAFELAVDARILQEYETVLHRPELDLPAVEVEELLRFVRLVDYLQKNVQPGETSEYLPQIVP